MNQETLKKISQRQNKNNNESEMLQRMITEQKTAKGKQFPKGTRSKS